MIGARQGGVERELAVAVCARSGRRRDVRAAARKFLVDRLADARLQLGEIARQVDDDVALLSVHGIQLDTEFHSVVVDFTAAITGHRTHRRTLVAAFADEVEESGSEAVLARSQMGNGAPMRRRQWDCPNWRVQGKPALRRGEGTRPARRAKTAQGDAMMSERKFGASRAGTVARPARLARRGRIHIPRQRSCDCSSRIRPWPHARV